VLEQWTTLAAAAAVTRRIGIGSFVTNVMNRHPAVLARMADVGIAKVHQTLTVDGANQAAAGLLELPLGAPVATVRRTITDRAGTCIYVADVVYRGDVVRLEIDLSPRPGEF